MQRHFETLFCTSFIIFNCLKAVVGGAAKTYGFRGAFEGRNFMEAPI